MRQSYIPDKHTYQIYKNFFQTGSGYNGNGYIYSVQNGSGIGGFLRSALKFAIPIGKKLLYKGYEMAKPELKNIANSAVKAATRVAENSISSTSSKVQNRINNIGKTKKRKRRKIDSLGA